MRGNFLYKKLGKRVCDFRRRNSLTQEEAAHRCGIDRTYLARIEAGKVNPTVKVLFNIAKVFGTKMMNLMRVL